MLVKRFADKTSLRVDALGIAFPPANLLASDTEAQLVVGTFISYDLGYPLLLQFSHGSLELLGNRVIDCRSA